MPIKVIKNKSIIQQIWKGILLVVLLFFIVLMIKITLPYTAIGETVAFLRIKRGVRELPFWQIAFYIHVFTSTFLLLAGFTQFSDYVLKNHKKWHRWLGKSYVVILLFFSGPAGLVMSLYANGGMISKIAFTLLSTLWLFTTWKAWQMAVKRAFKAHQNWMMRSFALTLSALTLRAWKYLIVMVLAPPPMDLYRVVAWLGWLPNLLLAEWLIRRKVEHRAAVLKK